MNHRRESRPDVSRRRPGWWQPLLILMAVVSCGLLIGMTTGGSSPPTCEAGGPCGPEAYFQQTIYWEDENSVCGDGWCDPNEGVWNCPADCTECGDGVCRPEEVDTCPGDCPVEVTCGDGICSHYENSEACPVDCEGITPTPKPQPTSTPRPASNGGSAGQSATSTPTPTEEPTDTPDEDTAEETEEAGEEQESTETEIEEPETEADTICEVVDVSDLPGELVDTFNEYYNSGSPHLFATCESVPKEVCVALEPDAEIPDAVLDVPGRVLLRRVTESNISIDDLGVVDLTYCINGGDCISYAPTSFDQASSLICFSVGDQELVPVCTDGCTFGLYKRTGQPEAEPSTPRDGGSQMTVSPLVIVILLGILILAVVALIIFLVLANRPSRD